MTEWLEIYRAGQAAVARGEPLWQATVMRVTGSAYRRAGAHLLFTTGRVLAGSVSAGCLETTIVRKGPWLTRTHPACSSFEGGLEDGEAGHASGTGCDGAVDILIEQVLTDAPHDPLAFIGECLSHEQRGALVTVFESSDCRLPIGSRVALRPGVKPMSSFASGAVASQLGLAAERALSEDKPRCRAIHGSGFEALLEIIEPPPHLFVFGTGPDAVPVVEFAHALGLGVTVCDTTARASLRERFSPGTEFHVGKTRSVLPKLDARRLPLAVVMSHHYQSDSEAIDTLLDSRAAYIGVLGPARRTARLLSELPRAKRSLGARDRARLRAPIGLDLGAETPAQIALSIMSEIQALLAGASAEPLSRRGPRPIHAPQPGPTPSCAANLARTGSS